MPASVRKILCMVIALGAAFYFEVRFFSNGYWLILSTLFAVSLQNHFYYRYPKLNLLITAFVASSLVFVATIFSYNVFVYSLFLVLLTYFSVSLGFEFRKYWQHAFVILFFVVLSSVLLTNLNGSVVRLEQICLGFLIAIICKSIFAPGKNALRLEVIKEILLAEKGYLDTLFAAIITRDYAKKNYFYEKNFHHYRYSALSKLNFLHQLLENSGDTNSIETQLQKLYENLVSLSNILLRIEDAAIYELASKEFLSMLDASDEILQSLANFSRPKKLDLFSYAIQQLQDVNMSGVQLVANDSLLFFLFIEDWKLLERRFELIASELVKDFPTHSDLIETEGKE